MGAPQRSHFSLFFHIIHRLAHDDATIDGDDFELDGEALIVLVFPGGTDFVPERLFALVDDVPGQKVRCVLGLLIGLVFVLIVRHDFLLGFGLACLRRSDRPDGLGLAVMSNTGEFLGEPARAGT